MSQSRLPGIQKPWVSACVFSPYAVLPRTPPLNKVAKRRRNKFPVTKFLTILGACLGSVFVASIVLEALDGDLDLWPFRSESFTVAPHGDLVIGSQPFSALFALSAIQVFVMTAGAHLVLRYRARSALATDSPFSPPFACHTAEPWVQDPKDAPVLGHLFSIEDQAMAGTQVGERGG